MKNITINKSGICSFFETNEGVGEYFIALYPAENNLAKALDALYKNYKKTLKKAGLSTETEIFRRFYLSDIANQRNEVMKSTIFRGSPESVSSLIQQCPLHGGSIAFFAYHIKKTNIKKETLQTVTKNKHGGIKAYGDNYNLITTAETSNIETFDSEKQTRAIFNDLDSILKDNKCSIIGNTIRTWIYVRDIDNHYKGMVKARREFFAQKGLNKNTRFIASTGIEGKSENSQSLVSMDTLSISGLDSRQIIRMEARRHLNPTHEYGVTFERGTRVDFGDRTHLYISGTASIDKHGKVVNISDIGKQTERVLENIKALLKPHRATLKDMAYFIVYVRNITNIKKVIKIIKKHKLNKLPIVYLEGAVCRPGWLVEIEGVAVINNKTKWPDFF